MLYLPCLGHLVFTRSFFNQKKGHLGHLAYISLGIQTPPEKVLGPPKHAYIYIYRTFSMCPPVKINQTSSHDSAKRKFTIQTFTWLLGYAFLHAFFAAHISCVEFSFTWLSWFIWVSFWCLMPSSRLCIGIPFHKEIPCKMV